MVEKVEKVDVKLQIPKAILDFLTMFEPVYEMTPEEAMVYFIVSTVEADIANGDTLCPEPKQMDKRFHLVQVFKEYGVCYWPDWEPHKVRKG